MPKLADLIVGNNVFAHVPDINDFVSSMSILLSPEGSISLEFPHLMELIKHNQFDTIYHEHFSYLSLGFVRRIAERFKLEVYDVEQLNTHGGSLRVWLGHTGRHPVMPSVSNVIALEQHANLESINTYNALQEQAFKVKYELLSFLLECKLKKKTVLAYGAAAKGNTLLNFCGVSSDLLPAVADKAITKQGKFMPGSHIPIIDYDTFVGQTVDYVIILPWNLKDEIIKDLPNCNSVVVAIPELTFQEL